MARLANHQKTVTSLCTANSAGPAATSAPRLLSGSLDGHVKVWPWLLIPVSRLCAGLNMERSYRQSSRQRLQSYCITVHPAHCWQCGAPYGCSAEDSKAICYDSEPKLESRNHWIAVDTVFACARCMSWMLSR